MKKTIGLMILVLVIGGLFFATVAIKGFSIAATAWLIAIALTALIGVALWLIVG